VGDRILASWTRLLCTVGALVAATPVATAPGGVATPGRLLVLETDGSVRVLVDGAKPTAASVFLIDVNAPAVSYDGKWLAFAGLPQGSWDDGAAASVGGWRLYVICADGTQLAQLTFSDEDDLDLSQHGTARDTLAGYDDFDPCWLPDGRIVFATTRFRSIAQYSGVRSSSLFIVGANGSGMPRIAAERNGADRPLVDPVTGKIVFARWWRNHHFRSSPWRLSCATYVATTLASATTRTPQCR
jgi:Tol biopolymer transport system component